MSIAVTIARALGGEATGPNRVLCPGVGHSRKDRSLSILLDPSAPDGFVVNSFAGDDPLAARDYIRAALGLGRWKPIKDTRTFRAGPAQARAASSRDVVMETGVYWRQVWGGARDPYNTVVETYVESRLLTLPDPICGDALRFHPALKLNGTTTAGMVALFRDIRTDVPCGVHRTFLTPDAQKIGRKMLGRAKGAAIKLDDDASVITGLHIGEGIETCIAARLAGFRPAWALGSAGGIAEFPVLAGIEALTILGEINDGGANARAAQKCASRWTEAGCEVAIVEPIAGDDLNAVWQGLRRG